MASAASVPPTLPGVDTAAGLALAQGDPRLYRKMLLRFRAGQADFARRFAEAGLAPDIVLSAIDADVIKTYVDVGLGIGIVAAMAYDVERDTNLVRIDVPDLFQPNTTRLAIRRGVYLRDYAYDFIFRLVPELNAERIAAALSKESLGREDFVI